MGGGLEYVVSEAAATHGASVAAETRDWSVAYAEVNAGLPRSTWAPYHDGWLPRLEA